NLPCLKDEAVQQGAHLGIPKGWVERFLNGLWRGEVLQGVGEIFRDPNEDRMHLEFIRGPTADAFQKSPANHALFVEVTRCEPVVLKSIETKQSQAKVDVSRRELAAISELLEEEVKKHAPSPETKNLHDLQNRLRAFRKEECRRRQIPAYRVLSNRTLEQLVQTRPQDIDELTQIHGVGPKMIAQYGKRFLELVKEQHASSDAEDAA
ncbi:MAG: hypothetical protein GY822_23645, partial [Deltaproteobacteria bacterium]|nr:hypothetical protein [Deltaproteobacteria bacterium]